MSQHSDTRARDKALADADREARIVDFLGAMPEDLEPSELEAVILAIANAYIPQGALLQFFLYIGVKAENADLSDEPTAH